MLRNYLAVALRNLARNRLYSGISILALAVGLCVATLAAVTLRGEVTYEHFIPGSDRVYLAAQLAAPTGHPPLYNIASPSFVAALLRLNSPQISAVTRLASDEVRLRHERTTARETIYWADPNAFDLLPLPVFAGDRQNALRRADGIVLTRSVAQKYFGRDDPIGREISLDDAHPMTITAVLEDLPVNGSTLESGIFASGLAAYSALSKCDRNAPGEAARNAVALCGRTYVQLKPGADAAGVQRAIDGFLPRFYPKFPGMTMEVRLVRIDRVHLFEGLNPGMEARLAAIGAVALAVLFTACVVFVNLSTARSVRRALEVGVRKVCGASRVELISQFLGESLVYVALAACLALALADVALPYVNAFLESAGRLDFAHDAGLVATVIAGVLVVGVLAGAYPAFVLSAFRPGAVLKGALPGHGGELARKSLVVLQFAVLIGLLVGASVIYRQHLHATRAALRVETDQMLILRCACRPAVLDELRALPGVRGANCSTEPWLDRRSFLNARLRDGSALAIDSTELDFGVFALYGIQPLAGRLPTDDRNDIGPTQNAAQIAINESAARSFGFKTPAAAIGRSPPIVGGDGDAAREIVAVVPDFAFDAGLHKVRPALFEGSAPADRAGYGLISVKLRGRDIPETLAAIDRISADTGTAADSPPERFFLNQYIEGLYLAVLREAQVLGVFAAVAIVLACLGLIGLSAATAESRTREIGIRKALGAGSADILKMLLWQFSKPILWANLLAWPVCALLLHRWLAGFADHIDLNPLTFVAAGAAALTLALATVAAHAVSVARAKPVAALRYE